MYSNVRYYILVILLISLQSATAQQVSTFVDTDSLQVGDIFEYTVVVNGGDELLSYPDQDDFEEDLELLDRNRYQVGVSRDSLVYRFQYFGTDDLTISRKPIVLSVAESDTTLYTNQVPLFFKTLLAEEDEEFRSLKPIFDFARSILPWLIGFILLLILGYLAYRLWQKQQAKPVAEKPSYQPVPFENPLEQLKIELDQLPSTENLNSFKEFESYYVKLGDAIRRYLKRVHGIPALEMTTSEIAASLKKEFVSVDVIAITRKVLNSADMVKFAHFEPTVEQANSTLDKAQEFYRIASKNDIDRINQMRNHHEKRENEKFEQVENQQK